MKKSLRRSRSKRKRKTKRKRGGVIPGEETYLPGEMKKHIFKYLKFPDLEELNDIIEKLEDLKPYEYHTYPYIKLDASAQRPVISIHITRSLPGVTKMIPYEEESRDPEDRDIMYYDYHLLESAIADALGQVNVPQGDVLFDGVKYALSEYFCDNDHFLGARNVIMHCDQDHSTWYQQHPNPNTGTLNTDLLRLFICLKRQLEHNPSMKIISSRIEHRQYYDGVSYIYHHTLKFISHFEKLIKIGNELNDVYKEIQVNSNTPFIEQNSPNSRPEQYVKILDQYLKELKQTTTIYISEPNEEFSVTKFVNAPYRLNSKPLSYFFKRPWERHGWPMLSQ